jgi:poly(beta-D-mannuronate) lyase
VFSNFGRSVINFYRGGFDESTLEGKLSINHCVFDKTGSKGDSPAINLVGISSVNIANTIFSWSPNTITGLSGSKNYIHNSNFYASKKPILSNGATEKNLLFVASELDNAWQTKSMKLIGKATDKQNIGLINPKSTIKNLNYEN